MTDAPQVSVKNYSSETPWFWKIFGGAIMSFIGLLLFSYIATINTNFDRSTSELRIEIKEMKQYLELAKERIVRLEQDKEKLTAVENNLKSNELVVNDYKQRFSALEAATAAAKEEIKTIREWNKELSKSITEIKERLASESGKKDAERPKTNQ